MTATVKFFTTDQFTPPTLLRRHTSTGGIVDMAYRDGRWRPSKAIIDWGAGHNDFVDPITEAEASAMFPGAFVSD